MVTATSRLLYKETEIETIGVTVTNGQKRTTTTRGYDELYERKPSCKQSMSDADNTRRQTIAGV